MSDNYNTLNISTTALVTEIIPYPCDKLTNTSSHDVTVSIGGEIITIVAGESLDLKPWYKFFNPNTGEER